MGQGIDNNSAILYAPRRAHFQTTSTTGIHCPNILGRGNNFRIGGKIWAFDVGA